MVISSVALLIFEIFLFSSAVVGGRDVDPLVLVRLCKLKKKNVNNSVRILKVVSIVTQSTVFKWCRTVAMH